MLLRRISKHVKDQNWFAVGIDFVIVVVGVFIGLQVTEWGQARADRVNERAALERLVVEYRNNLELLAKDKAKSRRTMAATARLLEMIAPEPDPGITEADIAPILNDCMTNAKFTPALGATNSLAASGELRLIGDPEIQRMLTQWPATAQVMIEWQDIERMHGEELILGFTYDYIAWPTLDVNDDGTGRPSRMTSDLQGLFSSLRFEGLLYNRWYNTGASIRRMEALEADTNALIQRMEARLAAL